MGTVGLWTIEEGVGMVTWEAAHVAVRERRGAVRPLVGWCLVLVVGTVLLRWSGTALHGPALTDPGGWPTWWRATDPLVAAATVLRLVGLATAWYLVGVTGISVVAHLLRDARLVSLADAISVGPVPSLVRRAVGVSLAVGAVVAAQPHPSPTAGPAAAATVGTAAPTTASSATALVGEHGAGPGDDTTPAAAPVDAPSPAALGDLVPVQPDPSTAPGDAGRDPARAAGTGRAGEGVDRARLVVVRPGDHLWGLAEADVRTAVGADATGSQVAAHWRRVVDANADRFVVPGNADLLVPGQVVQLPAVPS